MLQFAEYVSLGHPDKIADYISQYILDRYVEQDPTTRYAVEVQIKNDRVTLGGEVTSRCSFGADDLTRFVREAVNDVGYTREYQRRWGADNSICGDDLQVESLITHQSPDIARGVLNGWGDQGIFYGYAEPRPEYGNMPFAHSVAKRICHDLYVSRFGGLDIKAQVVADGERIRKIIVAIPLPENHTEAEVANYLRTHYKCDAYIVNGTGSYVRHSSIADCGTTGRKLAVDFYGGGIPVGGGSPWTKDCTKADLTLNLAARCMALGYMRKYGVAIYVSLACCIGSSQVDYCVRDAAGNVIREGDALHISVEDMRERFGLGLPLYASMCRFGLFGEYQRDKAWEQL